MALIGLQRTWLYLSQSSCLKGKAPAWLMKREGAAIVYDHILGDAKCSIKESNMMILLCFLICYPKLLVVFNCGGAEQASWKIDGHKFMRTPEAELERDCENLGSGCEVSRATTVSMAKHPTDTPTIQDEGQRPGLHGSILKLHSLSVAIIGVQPEQSITLPYEWRVADAMAYPPEDLIVVTGYLVDDKSYTQRLFVYDHKGAFIGTNNLSVIKDSDTVLRQLIFSGNHLVAQLWRPTGKEIGLSQFFTATLGREKGKISLSLDRDPFFELETVGVQNEYKLFIVEESSNQELVLISKASGRLWVVDGKNHSVLSEPIN